jgi:hypothetical protein
MLRQDDTANQLKTPHCCKQRLIENSNLTTKATLRAFTPAAGRSHNKPQVAAHQPHHDEPV